MQAAAGNFATFSATLYFDTDTDLSGFDTGSLSSALKSVLLPNLGKKPTEVCQSIANMLKYNDEQHAPLKVRFVWGRLDFMGYVASSSISYTMFSRDGTPLRAKLQLTIGRRGDRAFAAPDDPHLQLPQPHQGANAHRGGPLWLMAQQEYDDPAMWRTIAEANGILNPRKVSGAMRLKVPSIK